MQRLVAQQFSRQDWSRPDNQGCRMVEGQLQLQGWSDRRCVVIVRQRIKGGIVRERRTGGSQELQLDLQPIVHEGERLWDYAVLVTDVAYPLEAAGQLYRDRAGCRICQLSGFDELKNQWGLSGFTAQDINRFQTTVRACALVYNWWSWYCRAADPTARMAAVGKAASHAGQTTLYLTPMHGKMNYLKSLVANIRKALQHVRVAAEQFNAADPWATLLRYVSDRIAPLIGPIRPPSALAASGQLPDLN